MVIIAAQAIVNTVDGVRPRATPYIERHHILSGRGYYVHLTGEAYYWTDQGSENAKPNI